MKLIHQLISYFQWRGVLTPQHLAQLTADGFHGSLQCDDDNDHECEVRDWDRDNTSKDLTEQQLQRKDDEILKMEANLDRKRPVRSRIRKAGGGKKAKAGNSRDFAPALKGLSQRIAVGLANSGTILESLCRLEPSGMASSWEAAAAGIAERTDDELKDELGDALQNRDLDAHALWELLAVDLAALAGTGRSVVVRAFHVLLAQPDSRLPVRTKWDHRLMAKETLKHAVFLNKAQVRLTRAWGKLCIDRPDLPFAALKASPNELGLWTLALLHTAKRRFQLDASFLSSIHYPSPRQEPARHVCPPDLWQQAWACALRSDCEHVLPLFLWLNRQLDLRDVNGPLADARLVGPPGWNFVMHEAVKRRRQKQESPNV